jgi:hypothetical protein
VSWVMVAPKIRAHDIIFGSKFVRRSRDERRHHFLEPLEKKTNHEQKKKS